MKEVACDFGVRRLVATFPHFYRQKRRQVGALRIFVPPQSLTNLTGEIRKLRIRVARTVAFRNP
jgi:hypothetical protein